MCCRRILLPFALLLVALALARSADATSNFQFVVDDGESGERYLSPGDTAEYKVRIENDNGDERGFEITILNASELQSPTAVNAWWSNDGQSDLSGQRTSHSLRVSGGDARSGITLRLEAQATALYGWWDIELEGKDKDDDDKTTRTLTLRVHIDLVANLSITVAEGGAVNGSVEIDSTVKYTLELHNNGNRRDTYSLSIADVAPEWLVEWETDEVTLEARERRIVNLTVTVFDLVWYSDSDSITLKGRSANDAGVTGTLALTTFVRVENGLLIEPGTPDTGIREGEPGATVGYTLKVTNKWSEPVSFELQVNSPVGWSQPGHSGDNTIVGYGENTDTRVTVIIPSDASVGGYSIEVKARVGDGEWVQTALIVSVIGNYDLALTLSDDSEILLTAGQTKNLRESIEVHNRAKVSDVVTVTTKWEVGGNDWTIGLPDNIITLNPGQVKKINLKVTPPLGSEKEKATLLVTVTSTSDTSNPPEFAEQTISFEVNQAVEGSDPKTEDIGFTVDLPISAGWLVFIVLFLGLGGASLFAFQQKSKGGFGGVGEGEDYSEEWAGMEGEMGTTAATLGAVAPAPPAAPMAPVAPAPPMAAAPAAMAPAAPAPPAAAPPVGPVTIACPSCKTQLKIADTRRPLTVNCPTCTTPLTLSAPPAAPPAPPAAPAPPMAPAAPAPPAAAPAAPPAAPAAPPAAAGPVTIACPSCSTQLKIADTRRPLTVACPSCQTQLKLT